MRGYRGQREVYESTVARASQGQRGHRRVQAREGVGHCVATEQGLLLLAAVVFARVIAVHPGAQTGGGRGVAAGPREET